MSGASLQTRTRSRTRSTDSFVLTLWTNDPALARRADAAGIERVGVDLETLGKAERQRGLGTWVSPHRECDLNTIAPALERADLFVRLNPLNPDTRREVRSVLDRGAQVVMLPMVASAAEAEEFVALVDGAASVVLLVERAEALDGIAELVKVEGVDEIHIGINDLALSLGLGSRWQTLAGDEVKEAGAVVRAAGKRFGVGAIGMAGDNALPIPSDLVYAAYVRAGATAALVSRSFFSAGAVDLPTEIQRARSKLSEWARRSTADLEAAHEELTRRAARLECF
jgi:hypothetical protein